MTPKKANEPADDAAAPKETPPSGSAAPKPTHDDTFNPNLDKPLIVPDDLSALNAVAWSARDYGPITGTGAAKLADSAVAPLVALARGYRTIHNEDVKPLVTSLRATLNSTVGRQVKGAVGDTDALLMPWYRPAPGGTYVNASTQLRPAPANVMPDKKGKMRKYENVAGAPTVLGLHPATPPEVLYNCKQVFIIEGMLKADSVLSAWLLDQRGVSREDLTLQDGDTESTARARLTAMYENIPEDQRILIIGILGVGTWHNHPEWSEFNLKDSVVYVTFDGDVATNPNVHKQAEQLWSFIKKKKATPYLVTIPETSEDGRNKQGADDYLASGHGFSDLVHNASNNLPARPQADTAGKRVRMNDDLLWMEERGESEDGSAGDFVGKYPFIGRVVSIDTTREATPAEEATGRYSDNISVRDTDSTAVVEVRYRDPDDDTIKVERIEGPAQMLASKPEAWHTTRVGAHLPADVMNLPQWPPAPSWAEAMKGHRRADTIRTASWSHMGWVPRPRHDTPVFLVGEQVIGPEGLYGPSEDPDARCGVTERDLAKSTLFGVDMPDTDEDAREAVRDVIEKYRLCWSDERNFAVAIALALRPTAPTSPNVTALLSGTSNSGKSIPLDGLVPTPSGWVSVKDIRPGMSIFSGNGDVTRVRSLSPIFYDEDIYEVTLDDGQVICLSGNHTVSVSTKESRLAHLGTRPRKGVAKAKMLRDLADNLVSGDGATYMDIARAVDMSESYVYHILRAAGVSNQKVRLPRDRGLDSVETIGDFTLVRRPRLRIEDDRNGTIQSTFYSVPESLYAIAERLEGNSMPLEKSARLHELLDDVDTAGYALPLFGGFDAPEANLPVPAYTMGAWLGDGSKHSGDITGIDRQVFENIEADGYSVTHGTVPKAHYVRGLATGLRTAGVLGNKHIPMAYLRASRAQRLALLQGLMDTDGYINERGGLELALSDECLATDALELIRSLGIKATVRVNKAGYRREDGTYVDCKDRHRIAFYTTMPVFRLDRKASRVPAKMRQQHQWLAIKSIRKVEQVPSRCIQVEHPTGRFAHDGFVVTHNSWAVATIMAFWQHKPGTWTNKHLPGSAGDTVAATETAVSKTPIWPVDDLAPSGANPVEQAKQQGAVNAMIRNRHNGTAKRRMTSDMTSGKFQRPRALLIISAEAAPLQDTSIMNRLLHVPVQPGYLVPSREPTDALEKFNASTSKAAQMTGYCIRMVARKAARDGWESVYREYKDVTEDYSKDTSRVIIERHPGATNTSRQAGTVAEALIGIYQVQCMIEELGMEDEVVRGESELTYGDLTVQMYEGVQRIGIDGFSDSRRQSTGRMFMSRLASLLDSGAAHIEAAGTSGMPMPSTATKADGSVYSKAETDWINQRLGWTLPTDEGDKPRPGGRTVGWLTFDNRGQAVVIFSREAAFREVQSAFGKDGHHSKSMWDAVWNDGVAHTESEGGWKRARGSNNHETPDIRTTVNKHAVRGVPVLVSNLFDMSTE